MNVELLSAISNTVNITDIRQGIALNFNTKNVQLSAGYGGLRISTNNWMRR